MKAPHASHICKQMRALEAELPKGAAAAAAVRLLPALWAAEWRPSKPGSCMVTFGAASSSTAEAASETSAGVSASSQALAATLTPRAAALRAALRSPDFALTRPTEVSVILDVGFIRCSTCRAVWCVEGRQGR